LAPQLFEHLMRTPPLNEADVMLVHAELAIWRDGGWRCRCRKFRNRFPPATPVLRLG
jgi:hypothetical protein